MKHPKAFASPRQTRVSRAAAESEHHQAVIQGMFPPVPAWLPYLLAPPQADESDTADPQTAVTAAPAFQKTPHKLKHLDAELGKMVRLMLQKAGYENPKQWFDEMVTVQFLGKPANKIRPEFATALQAAEQILCGELAQEDPALADPVAAGKYLGIDEAHKTHRALKPEKPEYQSMHLFGLAIDINYYDNPWVGQTKNSKAALNKTLARMDALFQTTALKSDYKNAFTGADTEVGTTEEMGDIFDAYQRMDDHFVQYFGLLQDEDALQALLDQATAKPWQGKSLRAAKKEIQKDLDAMAKSWSRKGKKGKENLKREGIMDLDKRLVLAMKSAGLEWGGKFGDMMHFDMRFSGIGKDIQQSKRVQEVRDLKKALEAEREAREALEAERKAQEAAAAGGA